MDTMNYQLLGRSGLRVSDLCLGTMTFGEEWVGAPPKMKQKRSTMLSQGTEKEEP